MATSNLGRMTRRRWKVLAGVLILIVCAIAAIPWGLGTRPARRWLLAQANRALAPAGIDFATIRFSWFGPTRLTNFVLRDAQHDQVIASPNAVWDRNLRQILFERPRLGTFDLKSASLDVERHADGSIDLYEAIKPVLGKNPGTDLHIRMQRARLRFRTAGQPVPVTAERADLTLDVPAAPRPIAWNLQLENPATRNSAKLQIGGRFERWKPANTLVVEVKAQRWPWAVSVPGLESAGHLDGQFSLGREAGNWAVSGDLGLLDVDATGSRLAGDHLRLDRVTGSWNLTETAGTWVVHRLDLTSPLGSIKASGQRPASANAVAKVEGTLDLAAVARQLPHALRLRDGIALDRGSAKVRIESRDDPKQQGQGWDLEAKISDLEAQDHGRRFTLREPATLTGRLARRDQGQGIALERVAVRTAFLNVTGQGDVDRGIDWSGTIDLGGLQRQLRDLVDFGAIALAGAGELSGRYHRDGTRFQGRLTSDLRGLQVDGLAAGPLRRELLHLDLALDGTAAASGLPAALHSVRFDLASDDTTVKLTTKSGPNANSVTLDAKAPIVWVDPPRRAEGHLEAQWSSTGVVIDRLAVSLTALAENAKPGDEPIRVDAKGRYDRSAGEFVLTPTTAAPGPSAFALAPEGIRVSGLGGTGALRGSAGFAGDLGAVRQLIAPGDGASNGGLTGPWSARATAESTDDGVRFVGKVDLHPLMTSGPANEVVRDEGPITFSLNVLRPTDTNEFQVAELVLASRYATLEGSGRLTDPKGKRNADLHGSLTPRWDAINTLLAERVEPGARVSGKPRAWRIKGPVAGASLPDVLKSLDLEFGFEFADANIYGLRVGPLPIVARTREGRLEIDVIDTSLNGGRIHLEPVLTLDREHGSTLTLDENSSIANAEINDEVSRRFLSYVAPVLDRATRAHGRVSVDIEEAEFPLGGPVKREAKVEGQVVFEAVEFLPGPFAEQLLNLLGRTDRPTIKLDEPVALTIADRRVYQKGMALPLGQLTRVELEGWVDFDRNLELTASLPITAAMVGNAPVLSAMVENQRISVPIRGTLKNPEIDREAMNLSLKNLGQSILGNGMIRGAAEMFKQLQKPRDPNAPPPPTFQERRANRLERKAERRRQRGLEP
ncbi:translocation and assembly module TamB [Singulisphaera sp. GP187]|uniref:hypothetical protein n=1 Tax=Singulisphaera sp. GP187 TaxID=1882752 RepID=UPI0009289A47|nr:hypothetical protein [Singulisphaera sp. GP187]SIO58618.1 translocation and assembly module TamB [Singulisphaera sp. GP187]